MNKMPLCTYKTDFTIIWYKYPACFSLHIHLANNLFFDIVYYFSKAIIFHFIGKQEFVKMPRRTRKPKTIIGKNAYFNKKKIIAAMCLNLV